MPGIGIRTAARILLEIGDIAAVGCPHVMLATAHCGEDPAVGALDGSRS